MGSVKRVMIVLLVVAAMVLIPAAFADAQAVMVSVTGTKQGPFKGESRKAKDKIEAVSFVFEVTSPRDAATGQASGKRQYKPLQITKAVGASSPQFLQALATNEMLPTVTLEFTKTDKNGEEFVYYTIRLTNASVASIRQHIPTDTPAPSGPLARGASPSAAASAPVEEISFTFQKIEIENKEGKTMAADDWQQGR